MTPGVLIADPLPLVRIGIRSALETGGIAVVADVGTLEQTIDVMTTRQADVLLVAAELDPAMQNVGGLSLALPALRIVVLAPDAGSETLAIDAVIAGARGLLPKDTPPERLPAIVRGVVKGEMAIPRRLMHDVVYALRAASGVPVGGSASGLTAREAEVLELLGRGLVDKEVGDRLRISEVTVRRHAAAAARKLGVGRRQDAIALHVGSRISGRRLGQAG